ncbi:hypothetical protein ACSMXN_22080 [Jatrophihabitans sp. DSM 45814]
MRTLDTAHVSRLEPLSRAVFGQKLLLPIVLAVGYMTSEFTIADVAAAVRVKNASSVQRPMTRLSQGGFITKLGSRPGENVRWYRREPSTLWSLAEELDRRASSLGYPISISAVSSKEVALFDLPGLADR